jgi:hypothetical protein
MMIMGPASVSPTTAPGPRAIDLVTRQTRDVKRCCPPMAKRLAILANHLDPSSHRLTVSYDTCVPSHHLDNDNATIPLLRRNATSSTTTSSTMVRIGTVSVPLATPTDPTLVPVGYLFPTQTRALSTAQQLDTLSSNQDLLQALQFVMKKQVLQQGIATQYHHYCHHHYNYWNSRY